jgi:hypothetical protein
MSHWANHRDDCTKVSRNRSLCGLCARSGSGPIESGEITEIRLSECHLRSWRISRRNRKRPDSHQRQAPGSNAGNSARRSGIWKRRCQRRRRAGATSKTSGPFAPSMCETGGRTDRALLFAEAADAGRVKFGDKSATECGA